MIDFNALKLYLAETREKSSVIIGMEHIGADVRSNIKDLLKICENFQSLFDQISNQSADSRLAKKKLEQSKAETRAVENKFEDAKKMIMNMAGDIKTLSGEANAILKRHATTTDDADSQSAKQILNSAQSMVKSIVAMSKPDPSKN